MTEPEIVHEWTAARLSGTPVGGPDGFVICDSCNKGLTEVREEPTVHVEEVHVYVTQELNGDRWFLRRVNCQECGPVGSGENTEPDELHATSTLAYDSEMGCFVLDDAEPLTEGEQ